jgi:hypothetical protein
LLLQAQKVDQSPIAPPQIPEKTRSARDPERKLFFRLLR